MFGRSRRGKIRKKNVYILVVSVDCLLWVVYSLRVGMFSEFMLQQTLVIFACVAVGCCPRGPEPVDRPCTLWASEYFGYHGDSERQMSGES